MKVVKVVKSVGSGIVRGVKKVFKEVTKSNIGKALVIASAIYLGGAAFGMWESPFASLNGALASNPAAVELSSAGTSTAEASLAGGAATGTEAGIAGATKAGAGLGAEVGATETAANMAATEGVKAGAANTLASGGLDGALADSAANMSSVMGATNPITTTAMAGEPGLIQSAMNGAKSVGGWMEKNPLATAILGSAAANAAQPDALDVENQRKKNEMELYDWKARYVTPNWNVSQINLGFKPGAQQGLKTPTGQPVYRPTGLINTAMAR